MTKKQVRDRMRKIAFGDARNLPDAAIALDAGCSTRTVRRYRGKLAERAGVIDRRRLLIMLSDLLDECVTVKDALSVVDRIIVLLPPATASDAPDAAGAFLASILAAPDDTADGADAGDGDADAA